MSSNASSPPLKALIFDLDGTLSDTWPVALTAFRAAIEEHANREFSDEELMALAGPAEEGILQRLFPEHWEGCFEKYLALYSSKLIEGQILFPGIRELLDELHTRKFRLAVVSGKTQKAVEVSCLKAGVTELFDYLQGGSADGDRKAEYITDTIKRWDVPVSQVVYIGDTRGDITAAKAANTQAIGVTWAPTANAKSLRDAGADEVFPTVADLLHWTRCR